MISISSNVFTLLCNAHLVAVPQEPHPHHPVAHAPHAHPLDPVILIYDGFTDPHDRPDHDAPNPTPPLPHF